MTEQHVDLERLFSIAAGAEQRLDAAHLATCAECAASLARIQLVQATVVSDALLPGPSAAALARVTSLVRAQSRPARFFQPWETARRIAAALTFDSRVDLAGAGLRGASTSHLLTFAIDDVSLDVEIEPPGSPTGGLWSLAGQLSLGDEPLAAEIVAAGEAGDFAMTRSDAHGVFTLNLQPGEYDLLVQRDDHVVVISEIVIG